MNYEQKVLASAAKNREAWEKIEGQVEKGDFTDQALVVWRGIGAYYDRDKEAESCDVEILCSEIGRSLSTEKHRKEFTEIVRGLLAASVSPANVIHDFIAVRREATGAKLASALLAGRHDDVTSGLLADYETWAAADQLDTDEEGAEVTIGFPLEDLEKSYDPSELIKVWPSVLNNRLDGGLLRGHHMVVYARPEMGKTLFVVNATAGFLAQGLTVLYVQNEEPLQDVASRLIARMAGRTMAETHTDLPGAYKAAKGGGLDRCIFAKLYPGTVREIEKLMEEYQPDVLVVDQLRNVKTKEDNRVIQLEEVARGIRVLGKKYEALVVSVTQAGDSAAGKADLDMGDVDFSNTGIPATADIMVGIGASKEDESLGRRVLSLPKNKRSGEHGRVIVKCDPTRNRLVGVSQ